MKDERRRGAGAGKGDPGSGKHVLPFWCLLLPTSLTVTTTSLDIFFYTEVKVKLEVQLHILH